MKKEPIVYVLGVEGHFYLAEALKKEFDRPVIGIISCERIHEMMTPERKAIFDEIYSLPDFFFENIERIRALSRAELDDRQLHLEQKLGIANSAFLTNTDRRIRNIGNYRKIRNWQLCNLMFIDDLLSHVKPAFLLDSVITYLELALRAVCEKQNTPYLLSMDARNNRFAFYHTDGQQIGMQSLFTDFQNGRFDCASKEGLQEADQAYEAFINKPARPDYALTNSLTSLNWPVIRRKLSIAFDKDKLFPSPRVKKIDFYMNAELSFAGIVLNFIRSRYRRFLIKTCGLFNHSPDLTAPHVYVPLHYSPEISDLFFGTEYDHHEAFIVHLAKHMPSGMQLYVKEHTSMIGRRPISFYRNLKKIYSVDIIDPRVDTFDLIKNSKATITVTGTPGWEAFLLQKPSVAFGNVFYNQMPGVLHEFLKEDFHEKFKRYIENFKPDEMSVRNAFRAYYLTTHNIVKVDIGVTSTRENAQHRAMQFARAIRKTIFDWHDEMQGTFPAELITSEQSHNEKTAAHA